MKITTLDEFMLSDNDFMAMLPENYPHVRFLYLNFMN